MECTLSETANLTGWSDHYARGPEWLHQAGEMGWQETCEGQQKQVESLTSVME